MSRRISIAGISGSGKSTTSRALARRLGVPYVELDALFHGPNWSEPTDEEFRRRVREATDGHEGWVVDGNYHSRVGDLVLGRADTVVWLDLPLSRCLARVTGRTLSRIRTRENLWESGNRERIWTAFFMRNSLVHWTVKSYFRNRRRFPARFASYPELDVVRLRSPNEVARWLASLDHSPSQ